MSAIEKGFRVISSDREATVRSILELYSLKLIRDTNWVPPQSHTQHATDTQDGIQNHVSGVVESLVKMFHTVRIHEVPVELTFQAYSIRLKSNKLVLLKDQ